MERREFLKLCCSAMAAPLLVGCSSMHEVEAVPSSGKLEVPLSAFLKDGEGQEYRERILIRSGRTEYPVVLQRLGKEHYKALWLECTHQQCSLNVGGGIFRCPCHGSSFSQDGRVIEGPATRPLRTLKTEIDDERILVHLP